MSIQRRNQKRFTLKLKIMKLQHNKRNITPQAELTGIGMFNVQRAPMSNVFRVIPFQLTIV